MRTPSGSPGALVPFCALLALAACDPPREAEDPGAWFDAGSALQVTEPIPFTDAPLTTTGPVAIGDLPVPDDFETWFAPGDQPVEGCGAWRTVEALPAVVEGLVTVHPRFYLKVSGCRPDGEFEIESDEKFFGNFFVQDASGGHLVLNPSRVARFTMGDRVRLRVRAIKESFGSTMIASYDLLEVERGPEPVPYREVSGRLLDERDRAEVVRVEGVVAGELGGFGEIYLCTGEDPDTELALDQARGDLVPRCAHRRVADPPWYKLALDVELQRRGVAPPPGTPLRATGPVHLGFGDYELTILRIGQLTPL